MFIFIYVIFFIIFILLGFFIGKKYQEYFFYKGGGIVEKIEIQEKEIIKYELPEHVLDRVDFKGKYDKIIKVYESINGIGIKNNEKIDIILCKKNTDLTEEEKTLEKLINENKIYFKILLIEE